jgi:acyl carrier protein
MITEDQIQKTALAIIGRIAPEAEIDHINPDERFRNQFDFDSVDFMNFAVALQEKLNVEIPEEDFPRLATLKGCVTYLKSKLNP